MMSFENSPRWTFEVRGVSVTRESTRYHASLIRKWLIRRVLPGVPETFARPWRPGEGG